jgi:hypothetical protein
LIRVIIPLPVDEGGIAIVDALAAGYPLYRGGEITGTAAEIFRHATARLLAGELPPTETPKEAFRRTILRDAGVAEHELPPLDAVDAALGALTGLIALEHHHAAVGIHRRAPFGVRRRTAAFVGHRTAGSPRLRSPDSASFSASAASGTSPPGRQTLQGAICCTELLYNAAHWWIDMLRATKSPAICGASWEAAEGTRTLDLLHGKQTL